MKSKRKPKKKIDLTENEITYLVLGKDQNNVIDSSNNLKELKTKHRNILDRIEILKVEFDDIWHVVSEQVVRF